MGIRISQLSANALPYTGKELIPLVQNATTRAGTLSSFVSYLSGALLADSELRALSGTWQSTFTTTNANSGNWNSTFTTMTANSADWRNNFTTTYTQSANWQSTYTTTRANSSNWDNTYNTVYTMSSIWEGSGVILPTVTNYLSTNNILISSATITENISARKSVIALQSIIPVTVVNISTSRIFTNIDTNKIFHFDTTAGALTASFPKVLSQGFNVGITNVGTNYLYLSTNSQLKAIGNKLTDQYSGAYVYTNNTDIFAVGGV